MLLFIWMTTDAYWMLSLLHLIAPCQKSLQALFTDVTFASCALSDVHSPSSNPARHFEKEIALHNSLLSISRGFHFHILQFHSAALHCNWPLEQFIHLTNIQFIGKIKFSFSNQSLDYIKIKVFGGHLNLCFHCCIFLVIYMLLSTFVVSMLQTFQSSQVLQHSQWVF